MTSNREKAAEIIEPWVEKEWGYPEDNAASAADYLADAGLLRPDLPEPHKNSSTGTPVWWEKDTLGVTVYPDGEIGMMVEWGKVAFFTAETAREQALALLAAASYAEGEA